MTIGPSNATNCGTDRVEGSSALIDSAHHFNSGAKLHIPYHH
jgi:hypothetical protein